MPDPEIQFHPRDGSAWDLGHSLAAVGPGWWALVRQAHAEAHAVGATVALVRQKCCLLDVLVFPHPAGQDATTEIRERYQAASRSRCEICGGPAVPVEEIIPRPTRTHCARCAARWRDLGWDERALWMEAAGRWLPEWGG